MMAYDAAIDRRLRHLNSDIDRAKVVMYEIRCTLPDTSPNTWRKYQRLVRIYTNAGGILDVVRRSSQPGRFRQAAEDLNTVKAFIDKHEDHFPRRSRYLPRKSQVDSEARMKRRATSKSYQSNQNIRRAISPSILPKKDLKAPTISEAMHEAQPSNHQRIEVVDLTVDSDDDVVVADSRHQHQETYSPVVSQNETDEWDEYELRRELLLWYVPGEHLDEDLLP